MTRVREAVAASGEASFGPTRWRGRDAVRLSVSSWATRDADVDRLLEATRFAVAASANP